MRFEEELGKVIEKEIIRRMSLREENYIYKQKVRDAIEKCTDEVMSERGTDMEIIFPDELLKELKLNDRT